MFPPTTVVGGFVCPFPLSILWRRIAMKKVSYTTTGSVRGCCGHKHRTIASAVKCVHADSVGCARQGGYSDRYVIRHDGSELSAEEHDQVDSINGFTDFTQEIESMINCRKNPRFY